jgi:hypothetical protein
MAGAWTKVVAIVVALVTAAALWAGTADAALYWQAFPGTLEGANLDGSTQQTLAFDQNLPSVTPLPEFGSQLPCQGGIAVQGSSVYWSESQYGAIARVDLATGGMDRTFVTGLQDPCGVAVDGSHVYWADKYTGTIGRASLTGTDVERGFLSGVDGVCGIAVDDGELYWTALPSEDTSENYVARMPSGGGIAEHIYEASDDVENQVAPYCSIAADAAHVYFTTEFPTAIGRVDLDGSHPDPDFIPKSFACGVAVVGGRIYWMGWSGGARLIEAADLDGSPPVATAVTEPGGWPCALAADSAVLPPPPSPPERPQPPAKPPARPPLPPLVVHFGGSRYAKHGHATFVSVYFGQGGEFIPKATTTTGQPLRVKPVPGGTTAVNGPESRLLKVWLPKGRAARPLLERLRRRHKLRFEVTVQFVGPEFSIESATRRLYLVSPPSRR